MIFRTTDPIEKYRRWAKQNKLELLAGRRHHLHTQFVNRQVLSAIGIGPGAAVLDVGCGDGSLLAALAGQIVQGIGTVPTEEERLLLESRAHPTNIAFKTCRAAPLPFADATFDVTVMNGVILLLRDLKEASDALSELARVTKSDGRIWLGEALVARPPEPSKILKAIKNVRTLATGKRIPMTRPSLVTPADWIRAEAARLGLRIVLENTHAALDLDGVNPTENKTRRDFLLSKGASGDS